MHLLGPHYGVQRCLETGRVLVAFHLAGDFLESLDLGLFVRWTGFAGWHGALYQSQVGGGSIPLPPKSSIPRIIRLAATSVLVASNRPSFVKSSKHLMVAAGKVGSIFPVAPAAALRPRAAILTSNSIR